MANKPLTEDQKSQREKAAFRRKITSTFKNAGFEYLKTENIHRRFGLKMGELDYVFLFENIILICEDTISTSKDHIKNKKLLTDEIDSDKSNTIQWLKDDFQDKFTKFEDYTNDSYKIFHLYLPLKKVDFTNEDRDLYSPIRVIEYPSLNYLNVTAQTIKRSSRTEVFRLLGLKSGDVGLPGDGDSRNSIPTPIIYPANSTGLGNGIRIVSFMMSAEMLLANSYVLRKDSWEGTIKLYQRLLQRPKLIKTRKYIASTKASFFNNIIVSLPSGVVFERIDGTSIDLTDIHHYENCRMIIPNEINSICVIDGQHRIFAHYEGNDDLEPIVARLRKKLHLLVTGLIFPPGMTDLERRKCESEIFENINSNATPVPADVLLQIRSLQDPFSDLAIARRVLVLMNDRGVFRNQFQISQMDSGKIKVASIIKFALRYLVDITEDPDRPSLFQYWSGDRSSLLRRDDETKLAEYIDYVVRVVNQYFGIVKDSYKSEWEDPDSKIRSITAINGFVIALRKSLPACGVGDGTFYAAVLAKHRYEFAKLKFGYGSSQYNMFGEEILRENYGLGKDADGKWVQ